MRIALIMSRRSVGPVGLALVHDGKLYVSGEMRALAERKPMLPQSFMEKYDKYRDGQLTTKKVELSLELLESQRQWEYIALQDAFMESRGINLFVQWSDADKKAWAATLRPFDKAWSFLIESVYPTV